MYDDLIAAGTVRVKLRMLVRCSPIFFSDVQSMPMVHVPTPCDFSKNAASMHSVSWNDWKVKLAYKTLWQRQICESNTNKSVFEISRLV